MSSFSLLYSRLKSKQMEILNVKFVMKLMNSIHFALSSLITVWASVVMVTPKKAAMKTFTSVPTKLVMPTQCISTPFVPSTNHFVAFHLKP